MTHRQPMLLEGTMDLIIIIIIINICTNFMFTSHTHTPNQELHIQPYLPTFYHNKTLLYCIVSFK